MYKLRQVILAVPSNTASAARRFSALKQKHTCRRQGQERMSLFIHCHCFQLKRDFCFNCNKSSLFMMLLLKRSSLKNKELNSATHKLFVLLLQLIQNPYEGHAVAQ